MCLLSTVAMPPPYSTLYSPDIISLLILHQDQHHFHTNYSCRGNWPEEVIIQVILVTDYERLAPGQVLFIRGQVAFSENTMHVCHTCSECQSAALSARRMESERQLICFRLTVSFDARQASFTYCPMLINCVMNTGPHYTFILWLPSQY